MVEVSDESDGELRDNEGEIALPHLRPKRNTNYDHNKVKREPKDYNHYHNPSSNLHASLESTLMTHQHSMKKELNYLDMLKSMPCLAN
eukprot:scaffold95216_cov68-Attheya_sp.AAC.5